MSKFELPDEEIMKHMEEILEIILRNIPERYYLKNPREAQHDQPNKEATCRQDRQNRKK